MQPLVVDAVTEFKDAVLRANPHHITGTVAAACNISKWLGDHMPRLSGDCNDPQNSDKVLRVVFLFYGGTINGIQPSSIHS